MIKYIKAIIRRMRIDCLPKLTGFSLTWLPSLDFTFPKEEAQPNNLKKFEEFIDKSKWKKEYINHQEVWICDEDNTYQIAISSGDRPFEEEWVNKYPDKTATFQPIQLKIGGVVIKEIYYVYCDGGRIFVPLPKTAINKDGEFYYEWYKSSLEFKTAKILGEYYIWGSIESIAEQSKIKII